jgi:hypothetical protein
MFEVVRGCGHYALYGVNILNPGTPVLLFALCRNCQAVCPFVSHIKHLTPDAFNKIPTNNTCFDDTKFPFNVVYMFPPYIFFDATPTLSASNFTDFVYCNEIVSLFPSNTVNRVTTNSVLYCILHEVLILYPEYFNFHRISQCTVVRTIPAERPPLVGEVSANFVRIEGATWPS